MHPYFVIFALKCSDLTKCDISTVAKVYSIETALLCNQLFMEILRFNNWGIKKVLSRMQFGCLSSH